MITRIVRLWLHFVLSFSSLFFVVVSSTETRNAVPYSGQLWERGRIAYRFNSILDEKQKTIILEAMGQIENDTLLESGSCIEFCPAGNNERDFVQFSTSSNRKMGIQQVYFGSDCMSKIGIMPYLLMTIGLYREHQRPDRDHYVNVHTDNVKTDYHTQFYKYKRSVHLLGTEYDFDSMTHFGPYDHAIDKTRPTITSNVTGAVFGSKTRLSRRDVEKIQTMYQCARDESSYLHIPYKFIDCSFENPVCGLVNDVIPDAVWEKRSETAVIYGDHSRGDGYFMYSDSAGARILSLRFIPIGTHCIELFYVNSYQAIQNVSRNSTFVLTAENVLDKPFYILECCDNLVNYWTRFSVTVTAGFRWRLYIEARVDYQPNNGIAIDDVIVSNNACERPTAAVNLTSEVNSCET